MFQLSVKSTRSDLLSDPLSWTKSEQTQLAWHFEAVPFSVDFPHKVKTTYKKYSGDFAYEFIEDESYTPVPIEPILLRCPNWEPTKDTSLGIDHDGFHILRFIPDGPIQPAEFNENHFNGFRKCLDQVFKHLGTHPRVRKDWNEFSQIYPGAEQPVRVYLSRADIWFHVPLKKQLFPVNPVEEGIKLCQIVAAGPTTRSADSDFAGYANVREGFYLPSVIHESRTKDLLYNGVRLVMPSKVLLTKEEKELFERKQKTKKDFIINFYKQPRKPADYAELTIEEMVSIIAAKGKIQEMKTDKRIKKKYNKKEYLEL